MLKIRTIRPTRLRSVVALVALAAYGLAWSESPQGALAITPFTAASHDVSLRLTDGHVDLVLLHSQEPDSRPAAHPTRDHHEFAGHDPGHVVHLCGHDGAIASKTTAGHASAAPGFVSVRINSLDQSQPEISLRLRTVARAAPSPLRTTVLLI